MPQVLQTSNGRPEVIVYPKDFEDLIDKYMGAECANYYQNQIEQLSECIKSLASYVNDQAITEEVEEVLKVHGYK